MRPATQRPTEDRGMLKRGGIMERMRAGRSPGRTPPIHSGSVAEGHQSDPHFPWIEAASVRGSPVSEWKFRPESALAKAAERRFLARCLPAPRGVKSDPRGPAQRVHLT